MNKSDVAEALEIAANRLDRLALNAVPNSREWFEIKEWASEARRAREAAASGEKVRDALETLRGLANAIELEEYPVTAMQICKAADEIERSLARPAMEGWKLVPIEPTEEMYQAALDAQPGGKDWRKAFREFYRAMLSAAPHPKSKSGQ